MDERFQEFKELLAVLSEEEFDIEEIKEYMKKIQRVVAREMECGIEEEMSDEEKDRVKTEILAEYLASYKEELNQRIGLSPEQARRWEACRTLENLHQFNTSWYAALVDAIIRQEYDKRKEVKKTFLQLNAEANQARKFGQDMKKYFGIDEKLLDEMKKIIRECYQECQQTRQVYDKAKKNKPNFHDMIFQRIEAMRIQIDKEKSIPKIEYYLRYLEEYGFLDEFIEAANEYYDALGLSGLKLEKRNPLGQTTETQEERERKHKAPLEEGYLYDEKTGTYEYISKEKMRKLSKKQAQKVFAYGDYIYDEDIGVLDSLSKEELAKLSSDELLLLELFYGSKYAEERVKMERAMTAIRLADLWPEIINGDEKTIDEISDERIRAAHIRDLALIYLYDEEGKKKFDTEEPSITITPNMKRLYTNFLTKHGLEKVSIVEDLEALKPELSNIRRTTSELYQNQGMIVYRLKDGRMKDVKWGLAEKERVLADTPEAYQERLQGQELLIIAKKGFRGPIAMSVSLEALQEVFQGAKIKPFENQELLSTDYMDIMARLLLTSNPYVEAKAKEIYHADPSNVTAAYLANKPVKQATDNVAKKMESTGIAPEIPE